MLRLGAVDRTRASHRAGMCALTPLVKMNRDGSAEVPQAAEGV